jgi:uncharacterized protein
LQNFVPDDQHTKLAIIRRAARHLKPALSPRHAAPPPADDADIEALSRAAQGFLRAADLLSGKDADDARHLARLTAKLASAPPEIREKARRSLVPSLETTLGLLRASLDAQRVTVTSIPSNLARNCGVDPQCEARMYQLRRGRPGPCSISFRFVAGRAPARRRLGRCGFGRERAAHRAQILDPGSVSQSSRLM